MANAEISTSAQSVCEAAVTPEVVNKPPSSRPWLKPWQPGQSGNPHGPRTRLDKLARASTRRGEEIIELWLRMMRGEEPGTEGQMGLKWRYLASCRLAERGYGKPLSEVQVSERIEVRKVSVNALATLSDAELRQLLGLLQKAQVPALPAPNSRPPSPQI